MGGQLAETLFSCQEIFTGTPQQVFEWGGGGGGVAKLDEVFFEEGILGNFYLIPKMTENAL